jgi:hypothetical protein
MMSSLATFSGDVPQAAMTLWASMICNRGQPPLESTGSAPINQFYKDDQI